MLSDVKCCTQLRRIGLTTSLLYHCEVRLVTANGDARTLCTEIAGPRNDGP